MVAPLATTRSVSVVSEPLVVLTIGQRRKRFEDSVIAALEVAPELSPTSCKNDYIGACVPLQPYGGDIAGTDCNRYGTRPGPAVS